jgi:hypothetical protein
MRFSERLRLAAFVALLALAGLLALSTEEARAHDGAPPAAEAEAEAKAEAGTAECCHAAETACGPHAGLAGSGSALRGRPGAGRTLPGPSALREPRALDPPSAVPIYG